MVIPIGVCTPTGPQRGARNPHTLFRVRFSWASLFRWYALKNARVPPAIVLSRLRRAKNGQTSDPSFARRGLKSRLAHNNRSEFFHTIPGFSKPYYRPSWAPFSYHARH